MPDDKPKDHLCEMPNCLGRFKTRPGFKYCECCMFLKMLDYKCVDAED